MKNSQFYSNYSTMLLALIQEYSDYFWHAGYFLEMANLSKSELDAILNGEQEISVSKLLKMLSISNLYQQNMISTLFIATTCRNRVVFIFNMGTLTKVKMIYLTFISVFLKETNLLVV